MGQNHYDRRRNMIWNAFYGTRTQIQFMGQNHQTDEEI